MTTIGVMLPADLPAPEVVRLARRAAEAGVDELWVPEDLGRHGGVALAASLLSEVAGVTVGLGIAPAAARHPAFLAMQAATLGQLHPDRFHLGIGHGMPVWMRQLGIWPRSPLTRLEETFAAVRALLAGGPVDLDGREVRLDGVALVTAPVDVPLLAGVRGPRSIDVAARAADGVVLAGWSGPAYTAAVRARLDRVAAGRPRRLVASARLAFHPGPGGDARRRIVEELRAKLSRGGLGDQLAPTGRDQSDVEGLVDEVAIAGGAAEVRTGVAAWAAAGADVVLLDPQRGDDLERLADAGALA